MWSGFLPTEFVSAEFGEETSLPKDYLFWECECSKSLHVAVTEDSVMEYIWEFPQSVMSVGPFSVISFFLLKMQWDFCLYHWSSVAFTEPSSRCRLS